MDKKNYYFASDFHLGAPSYEISRAREAKLVAWLNFIKKDAAALFLMGDVFDFWFEYSTVIPKGYVRLLGKLAELSDEGTKIYFFKGNHDMWVFDYFEKELNATIVSDELVLKLKDKRFFLHHGDGLGKGDNAYKVLKNFFRSSFCQWLFARLHPNLGVGIANYWSKKSRLANNKKEAYLHIDREKTWLANYYDQLKQQYGEVDYIIMGHRHFPVVLPVQQAQYVNLGEWVNFATYAVFDGTSLKLIDFDTNKAVNE